MKKRVYMKLVAMLLTALTTPVLTVAETITYTATYDYSNLTIGTDTLGGETYAVIHYGDLFNNGKPGAPSLPVDYINFSVPYNATNFRVSTTTSAAGTNDIGLEPYPCQITVPTNGNSVYTITLPDTSIYDSGEYYPALTQNAWIEDEGFIASENHIVTVAVMPISYRFRSGHELLRKSSQVFITLQYDLVNPLQDHPIIRRDTALRSESYRYTQSLVVNPGSVINNAPSMTLQNPMLSSNASSYPYIIITTPELKHSLRRVAALKRQKGYNVKIATIDEIMVDEDAQCGDVIHVNELMIDDTTFTDSAGVMRQYLRNAHHNNNAQYVFLVGDSIPVRSVDYIDRENNKTYYDIPSDMYFSELDGDWSTDGYGQRIERVCELSVGRIMAKSETDVSNYTDKLFRFELQPYSGETDYRHRALFSTCRALSHDNSTKNFYRFIFYDQHNINETSDGKYPSGAIIVDTINEKHFGLISFMNYATPYGVITSGFSECSPSDSINCLWAIDSIRVSDKNIYPASCNHSGLNNMNNKMYPSIGYSTGNSTFLIDHKYHNTFIENDFANSFVLGKDYGGPAFIGHTRDVNINEASNLEYSFARQIPDCITNIGDAFTLAKIINIQNTYTCITNNLCGDPEFSLGVYAYVIDNNSPTFHVYRYDNSVQINSSGYETISYTDNGGLVSKHSLNDSGITVINNLSPNGCIMAFRDYDAVGPSKAFPYIAPLVLQNTTIYNSQYVIANDVTAGNSIESSRTSGNVIVSTGVEYEIEASGTVTLEDGFEVEEGATFAVYPACY